jgi:protein-S-isoprenylcysteine O-methyltransferase Ste14
MQKKNGEHPFGDAGQLIWLGVFLVVWIGDSFFLHFSTFLSNYVPLYIRLVLLGLLLIVAVVLSRSGHVVVSQEQWPNHVITSGTFRYVRHPLYLASLLTYLGLTVSTLSLASLVIWGGILGFHDYIASYEERLLERKFGEAYQAYKKKTGKWLPKL